MILSYNGLGDAIVNFDLLLTLCKAEKNYVYAPINTATELLSELCNVEMNNVNFYSEKYRKIIDLDFEEVKVFINKNQISNIISIRKDFLYEYRAISQLREKLKEVNISYLGLDDFFSREEVCSLNFKVLNKLFLDKLAIKKKIHLVSFEYINSLQSKENKDEIHFCIYPGSSIQKKWIRVKDVYETLSIITKRYPLKKMSITILSGHSEQEIRHSLQIKKISESFRLRTRMLNQPNLIEVFYTTKSADIVITADTYVLHLCDKLKIPTISFFYSTNSMIYGTLLDYSVTIQNEKYNTCELRNDIGNCNNWALPCALEPCRNVNLKANIIKSLEEIDNLIKEI